MFIKLEDGRFFNLASVFIADPAGTEDKLYLYNGTGTEIGLLTQWDAQVVLALLNDQARRNECLARECNPDLVKNLMEDKR